MLYRDLALNGSKPSERNLTLFHLVDIRYNHWCVELDHNDAIITKTFNNGLGLGYLFDLRSFEVLSYRVLASFGVVISYENFSIRGIYLVGFHYFNIEDSALELFNYDVHLIFLDHLLDRNLSVGHYDKFGQVYCAFIIFKMVVSQVHF